MLDSLDPQQSSNSSVMSFITAGNPLESSPFASSLLLSLVYYNALFLLFAVLELLVLRLIRIIFPGINSDLYHIIEFSISSVIQVPTFLGIASIYYIIFILAPTSILLLIIHARMPADH
ncbi:uncharacterized protein BO66DRAFT_444150 [Aspergillus aculeatinus CBS 121060]|uniref:Uncharacterized protein n=1 Tax=Aspergillus aculeatinus CBS 121060 TaxID=1448322 RepID=A0ACD1GSQ9_9EURO|nr:hypothetical protein BO66DRAFT_444150 [Aspergillus aculeatinus CBS 121060]RAH64296.1 hypothetical protein BO66DRAFT_444150 [Aspergillus aculeatinus CBS 121060]